MNSEKLGVIFSICLILVFGILINNFSTLEVELPRILEVKKPRIEESKITNLHNPLRLIQPILQLLSTSYDLYLLEVRLNYVIDKKLSLMDLDSQFYTEDIESLKSAKKKAGFLKCCALLSTNRFRVFENLKDIDEMD